MTRKGSEQLTDDERASQVASPTLAPGEMDQTILKYPATLTEAERKSQKFWTPERLQGIRYAQKRRAKMTEEERAVDLEKTRLSMGLLPIDIVQEMRERDKQRGNPKRPYISLDDEAAALALQTAVPDPI